MIKAKVTFFYTGGATTMVTLDVANQDELQAMLTSWTDALIKGSSVSISIPSTGLFTTIFPHHLTNVTAEVLQEVS